MKAEVRPTQRHLVGLRLRMADAELVTKYVFPFLDDNWSVAFTVVDALSYGPRVLRGNLELREGVLRTDARTSQLEKITTVPLERFGELVHFDPWWAFRGIGGVPREWIEAVIASNVAGTFNHEGTTYKLHDLTFNASLTALDVLLAKDPVFREVSFARGDVDLLQLRHPQRR